MLLGIVLLGTDASMVFTQQSNYWNVSHNTARLVARHALDTDAGVEYARGQLRFAGYTPDVDILINDEEQTVTVTVIGQSAALAPFGVLELVLDERISVEATQSLEPL